MGVGGEVRGHECSAGRDLPLGVNGGPRIRARCDPEPSNPTTPALTASPPVRIALEDVRVAFGYHPLRGRA